ncbi:AAA-type ATPase (transitional ATPase-like protein) [Haloferax elongans ATCC BAA-1513]|uniref:AAA-type ATPase (Transitional ATPase-like protein) n=1 Tax=Haloferax elongans ATCC BAA-1513 TaxID=1230453 RepID=M0HN70_HALEO|nr:AAA family ATPase [Haloferax elongans]ELZ85956.1 AAA-type ATPase (transitional ATPase-like protein) [Haloferax elongans ATCC BAA-1513]
MAENGVTLVVRAAEKRDAGRGIARLPEDARKELGVLSGETVVIDGSRETVAKMWPARPGADAGEILVDADTRANAGVKIGDSVNVRKVSVEDATAVTLAGPDALDRTSVSRDTVEEVVRAEIRNRPLRSGDRVRVERLGGAALTVKSTTPEGIVRVTDSTKVTVTVDSSKGASEAVRDAVKTVTGGEKSDGSRGRATGITYEDIGGLDDELELVREMIELPLSEPEVFTHLGTESPKGVLLHGPPGTGKTLIAKAVANEVNATFITVSGPEVVSKYKGESEEKLREVFQAAREESPSIIFFDEIDSIASKRDDGGDLESRVVGQLLSLMDGLDARGDVIVIGATNRVDSLDPALRRGGRFDREIEIGVPNEPGRREILDVYTRRMPLADDVDVDRLASRTHGFVGADLESLAKEAAMTALRRARRNGADSPISEMTVTRADFEAAMAAVEPSAMREYVAEQPTKGFEAVGGLDDVKQTLERAVTWPLTYAPLFEAASTDPPTGVLLHGPPGTGKTLLARAIAAESGVNFIHVAGPELLAAPVGESEKSVREVFARARQAAPSILFFDEIDALATDRDSMSSDSGVAERVVSQLLTEMDIAADNPNLVVLAATNRRDALDPALLRPGRLETHVEVPNPDIEARRAIIDVHVRNKPLSTDIDLDDVAAHMDGFSGADVAAVCREAALRAIEDVANAYEGTAANDHADEIRITREHFNAAISTVRPMLD